MLSIVAPQTALAVREEPKPVPVVAPPVATPRALPTDQNVTHVLSLLAFLEERSEKARAAVAADAKLQQERYRTDVDLLIERERLASKERIAQLEAQSRNARAPVQPDPEASAQRTREIVREEIRNAMQMMPTRGYRDYEHNEDEEDDNEGSPPSRGLGDGGEVVAAIRELKEGLAPFVPLLLAKFGPQPPPTSVPDAPPADPPSAPPKPARKGGNGNGGGQEPSQ